MADGVKNYLVDYLISTNAEQVAKHFATLGQNAESAAKPMSALVKNMATIKSVVNELARAKGAITAPITIDATVNTDALKAKLANVENLVKQSAIRMSKSISRAVVGKSPLRSEDAIKKDIEETEKNLKALSNSFGKNGKLNTKGIEDETKRLNAFKKELSETKKVSKSLGSDKNSLAALKPLGSNEVGALADSLTKLQTAMKGFNGRKSIAPKITGNPNDALVLGNMANSLEKLNSQMGKFSNTKKIAPKMSLDNKVVKSMERLGTALEKINANRGTGKKPLSINVTLNTATAMEQLEQLLAKIKASKATISIGLASSSKGAKGKGGAAAPMSDEQINNYANAVKNFNKAATGVNNRKSIAPKINVKTDQVEQLGKLATHLQDINKALGKKGGATTIKVSLDTSRALTQLKELLAKINSSTASVKATLAASAAGGAVGASSGGNTTIAGASVQTAKNPPSGGTKQTNVGGIKTQNNTHYQKWQQEQLNKSLTDSRALRDQDQRVRARQYAARQAHYERMFGQGTPGYEHEQALRNAAAYNEQRRLARNASARKVARAGYGQIVFPEETQQGRQTSARAASTGGYRGGVYMGGGSGRTYRPTTSYTRTAARPDLYTRARKFWYPFTGNTSFGARTPMAVDMAKGMGAMFAIGGAMSAIGSSFGQAVEYQNIMRTTNAILENSGSEYSVPAFKNMEATVRDVGKKTKFTAPQVADAARFLAMAGYDIKGINHAIRPVADVAIIGDTDLGQTADKLTNVMTTFGIDPSKMRDVADIMTTTFTRSNVDMMMLAESSKYAGAIAHMYGKNKQNTFADTMAMFGILGNAGIQASLGGTTIRMMYQNLMQPNKKQLAALQHYQIYTRDANHQPLEMAEIIHQIAQKVPEAELADAVGTMFRITAQPGASALASHIPELDKLLQANRNAVGSGISEKISLEKQNTIQGLWYQVTSTFTEAIVQAFEAREGGWAGMLANLRDYLAKPETIEVLANVVDLVETLGKAMGKFADIWAKMYSFAPGLFKAWMYAQLVFTQIGYLATPFVQLIGTLSSLKVALMGTSAAAQISAATSGMAGRIGSVGGAAMMAGSAIGGRQAAFSAINATHAANVGAIMAGAAAKPVTGRAAVFAANAGMLAALKNKQYRYEYLANRAAVASKNSASLGGDAAFWAMAITNPAKAYNSTQSGKYAILSQNTKKFAENAKVQRLDALRAMRRPEQLANTALMLRYNQMLSHAVAKNGGPVASNVAATLAAKRTAERVALLGEEKASRLMALKNARRAEQIGNVGLMARYSRIVGNNAVGSNRLMLDQWRAQQAERLATLREARRPAQAANAALIARSGKLGFGMKSAFNAGMAMTMFAGLGTTLKTMFTGLMMGLSKAVGLLVSPVGLAVTAVAALGFAAWKFYDNEKKKREEANKNAQKVSQAANEQRGKLQKNLNDEWKKTIGGNGLISPNGGQLPVTAKKSEMDKLKAAYADAFSKKIDYTNTSAVSALWGKSVSQNRNMQLAVGSKNYNKLISGEDLSIDLRPSTNVVNNMSMGNAITSAYLKESDAAGRAAKTNALTAVMAAGGDQQSVMAAQIKIKSLREQLIAKKITQKAYNEQTQAIIDSTANISAPGLLDANNYTPGQIQNMDWTKFLQFQQGAMNVLKAERDALAGTMSGYLQGVQTLKNGVTMYSQDWLTATNQILAAYRYPIEVAGQTVNVAIKMLPSGQIDYKSILENLRQVASNYNLTLSQFSDLIYQTYEIIANATGGGKYYREWIKNAYDQSYGTRQLGEFVWRNNWYGAKSVNGNDDDNMEDWLDNYVNNQGKEWKELRAKSAKRFANIKGVRDKRRHDNAAKATAAAAQKQKDEAKKLLNGGGDGGTNTPKWTPPGKSNKDSQKDYENKYNRSSARPTQVIINIDKLCNFDRTAVVKDANDREIAEAMEQKIAEAVSMLASQALTEMSSVVSQGTA